MNVIEDMKIMTPDRGQVIFQPYQFQRQLIELFRMKKNIIINKSRQMGISTVAYLYALEVCLTRKSANVVIAVYNSEGARQSMSRAVNTLNALGSDVRLKYVNRSELMFDNESMLIIEPYHALQTQLCSRSIDTIIYDEAAHRAEFGDLRKQLFTAMYSHGQTIIISTQKKGSHFNGVWNDTLNGETDYIPILLPWFMHPERDPAWARTTRMAIGDVSFNEEFACGMRLE